MNRLDGRTATATGASRSARSAVTTSPVMDTSRASKSIPA